MMADLKHDNIDEWRRLGSKGDSGIDVVTNPGALANPDVANEDTVTLAASMPRSRENFAPERRSSVEDDGNVLVFCRTGKEWIRRQVGKMQK